MIGIGVAGTAARIGCVAHDAPADAASFRKFLRRKCILLCRSMRTKLDFAVKRYELLAIHDKDMSNDDFMSQLI